MTHTLLPIAYAGPISHWIPICKEQAIIWEVEDNYQKQTYRNRMEIHAANGKLMLSIPIKHLGYDGHQKYKDVSIANTFPWQRNHWLSIKTVEVYMEMNDGSYDSYYIPLRMIRGEKEFVNQTVTTIDDWAWAIPTYTFEIDNNLNDIKYILINPNGLVADVNPKNDVYYKAE